MSLTDRPSDPLRPSGPLTPQQLSRGLRSAQREAVPFAVMTGLTEPFMIPYALALGAGAFQAGLLTSFRNLVLSLAQLASAAAAARAASRKRLVLAAAWLQALLWLPLAVVGPLCGPWAVPALIVLYTLGSTSAAFGGPAWGSLVSEYLAPEERGRFFGLRTRLVGGWATVIGLAGGGLLHLARARPLLGFGALCAAAAAARLVSCRLLAQLEETPWQEPREARFTFGQFLRQWRTSNFARFTLCQGVFSFTVYLASPFMAVYMLEDLRYSYLAYTAVVLAGSGMTYAAVTRWGRLADRFGNWIVLRWTMLGVTVLPLLWGLSGGVPWLVAVNLLAGFVWGGLNLSMVNFVYDVARPAKRTRCLAYFNVINGCGISLGSLAGGWLVGHLPRLGGSAFLSLFVLSTLLRIGVALAFPRLVREVRPVRGAGLREVVDDLLGQRVSQLLGRA